MDLRPVRATSSWVGTAVKEHWGVGRIEHGDCAWWGNGKRWRSTPGCILLKQPGDVVRHLAYSGPQTFVAMQLPGAEVERAFRHGRALTLAQIEPGDERGTPFHRLIDAALEGDRLALDVTLAEALGSLVRHLGAPPDRSLPVRRAVEYIRGRLAESFSLDELADHADLDKFHLCRAFRAQVGIPPHAYRTHLRIARAKELLRGGVRASVVAPLVGMYDQAQLTRHFRQLTGTTPASYARAPRTEDRPATVARSAEAR